MTRLWLWAVLILFGIVPLNAQSRLRVVRDCFGCIAILTTDTAQTIVAASPSPSTFVIKAGTHRLDSITPRAGDTFIGETGAILSGAKLLASGSFVNVSGVWHITGQTQTVATRVGTCQATGGSIAWATDYPGCDYAEELYFDGSTRKTRVTSLGGVAAGKWYFDDAADTIYIGDDPTGHTVETSVTTFAFNNGVNDVTIRGLIVEHYATMAQYGPINAESTSNWTVRDNDLRYNHGGGMRFGNRSTVTNNHIHHNGEIGIVGIGDDFVFQNNEVDHNNTAHFDPGWEGGGSKFFATNRLIVRGNNFHDNEGPGIWLDGDNINYDVVGNTSTSNDHVGIFTEISCNGTIRNNTVTGNGLAYWVPGYVWGVGILNAASHHVEISWNTLSGNRGGIAGIQQSRGSDTNCGSHLITSFNVHDNAVTINRTGITPAWNGLADDTGSSTIFVSDNNHFEANTYTLKTDTAYFVWNNIGDMTFSTWSGTYGHDSPSGSASTF